jgi:predicted RNA-binding Zn ribbon-like protein
MVTSEHLIEDFVNTLHMDPGPPYEDVLATPEQLGDWFRARGLLGDEPVAPADVESATRLREALRTLLLANNGVEVDAARAWREVDDAARRARVELRFSGEGEPLYTPAAPRVDGALGQVVAAVHEAIAEERWSRLKACRARDCEWAFDDTTKNRSRAWCSMRSCGNREKARAFRRRHTGSG